MARDEHPAWVRVEDATAVGESEKGLRVEVGGETEWIPKSQIHDDSEVYARGHAGPIIVAGWLAHEKGWDGEEYEP